MPTLYPERYTGPFDLVFRGEADLSFPNFCQDYFAHQADRKTLYKLDLARYPGLYGRTLDLIVDNPVIHYSRQEIRSFPHPRPERVRSRSLPAAHGWKKMAPTPPRSWSH